ncbi:SIMPL domain-containing protein [Altererythrobacter sp. MTPC7]|uniref:SIMPL domain-containing protein n=1 Tax=Altererythrobacter sp. MTPC7 TaxID=3056567 RepID=UPI0036F36D45
MTHLRKYAAALAVSSATLAALPAAAAEVQIAATNPVVELSVYEEVEVEPDTVTISAGVVTDAPTAVEAMRRNSEQMARVIEEIEAQGIAERDIQTTGISLNARYDYNQREQRQIFQGYRAANRVSVKFRDVARVGPILDTLVAAGANDLSGPTFSKEDDSEAKAQARSRALETGRAMAMAYARTAGYSGVRILQISESVQKNGPRPQSDAIIVTASRSEGAPVPVRPGVIGTGVNVSITYEMTGGPGA